MVMARFKSFLLVSLLFGLSMFTSSAQTDDFYAQYEKFRKCSRRIVLCLAMAGYCSGKGQCCAIVRQ